jgi:dienelactone hydrolase
MDSWGPFYASHGIVTVIVTTDGADIPDIRASRLLAAIDELKKLNTDSGSPISGKLSGRYGTSGYSMGGGGTTIASGQSAELKTSVGLAAWGGSGQGVKVPTLLFCGDADTVAPCNMSDGVYAGIDDSTPKMQITISGVTHFDWFGPGDAGRGTSGSYALAFQKVYLEGDTRWKDLLLKQPGAGKLLTNIK